jgi:hypothetical protein
MPGLGRVVAIGQEEGIYWPGGKPPGASIKVVRLGGWVPASVRRLPWTWMKASRTPMEVP